MTWRDELTHIHEVGPRWIVPRLEHPEFEYGPAGALRMECPGRPEHGIHQRDGGEVLEFNKDEFCVTCGAPLEPIRKTIIHHTRFYRRTEIEGGSIDLIAYERAIHERSGMRLDCVVWGRPYFGEEVELSFSNEMA